MQSECLPPWTVSIEIYRGTQLLCGHWITSARGLEVNWLIMRLKASPSLGIKNIVAVLIDRNDASRKLLEKLGFQQWGYLPRVLDFDGQECGEFYYGKRVAD